MDEMELNRALTQAAFRGDWNLHSALKRQLLAIWVFRGSHRPSVPFHITRNGIDLYLQWIEGSNYKYVSHSQWNYDAYVERPSPLRELIMTEIRIGSKALREALLLENPNYKEDALGNVVLDNNSNS